MHIKQIWYATSAFLLVLGLAACSGRQQAAAPSGQESTNAVGQLGAGSPTNTNVLSIQSTSVTQSTPVTTAVQGNVANGEEIYFRSVDQQGQTIPYSGGPAFRGMMMGSYLTCASCHGPEAYGGKHVMMGMQVMDAPPIYYDALVSMAQKDAGKSTYTLEDFRKAVVQGQDVDGSALSQDMPHWQMSDQDLSDLFAFLKTIH